MDNLGVIVQRRGDLKDHIMLGMIGVHSHQTKQGTFLMRGPPNQ